MSDILQIFHAALAAVDPFRLTCENLHRLGNRSAVGSLRCDLDEIRDIVVVGAGKAAAAMGLAAEAVLADRISAGLLVLPLGDRASFKILGQAHAAHPLPDEAGERATREILSLLGSSREKSLVLCLLSGGASALLAAPAAGVTLDDKRIVTSMLLHAGAAIDELNAVRKHLSRVKGGRLAAAAFPAAVHTLLLSDVSGDRLDVIGSGPTAHDPGTYADALAVVDKFGLRGRMPERARGLLERGAAGLEEETVKPGDPRLARTTHRIIGNNGTALEAARKKASGLGFAAEVSPASLAGEAATAGCVLAASARRAQARLNPGEKRCLLSGGETTVTVRGRGRGGRNQELALAFAREIAGTAGVMLLSAGTDGADGSTDAAGAIVDGHTWERAARFGLDAAAFLDDNDSYSFFCELDRRGGGRHHLMTGSTGTNVMDLQVLLLSRPS